MNNLGKELMYLCNCNGLKVTDVIKACSNDASTATDVFNCHGVKQCCGKCVPEIEECIENSNKQTTFQNSAPKVTKYQNLGSINSNFIS